MLPKIGKASTPNEIQPTVQKCRLVDEREARRLPGIGPGNAGAPIKTAVEIRHGDQRFEIIDIDGPPAGQVDPPAKVCSAGFIIEETTGQRHGIVEKVARKAPAQPQVKGDLIGFTCEEKPLASAVPSASVTKTCNGLGERKKLPLFIAPKS